MDRELFRRLLAQHGLTVSQLATDIGVNRLTISRWLDGTVTPTLAGAKALANRLESSVDALWPSPKDDKR